jgi:hypothetical protein
MLWVGWVFDTRRSRWERACEGDTLAECSRKLSAVVDARGTRDKFATMTGGGMPSFRPAGRESGERSVAKVPMVHPTILTRPEATEAS